MASTSMTPDQDAIICEIQISALPELVFQALIDPKQVMQWWTSETCAIEDFTIEAKRGGRWSYDTKQSGLNVNVVSKFHCEGEVLGHDLRACSHILGLQTGMKIKRVAPLSDGS